MNKKVRLLTISMLTAGAMLAAHANPAKAEEPVMPEERLPVQTEQVNNNMAKDMTPPVMPSKKPFDSKQFKPKKKELELNWNLAIGNATFEEDDTTQTMESMGLMLEMNPGINVTTAPGLDVGMVVGFVLLNSTVDFSVEHDGPPSFTRNWSVAAITVGSYILAKYSYDIDLSFMKIGLENGYGIGYFVNSVSADYVDSNDSSTGSESGDDMGWQPVVKAGLKLDFPVTEVSALGLNINATVAAMQTEGYLNFLTTGIGLNYQVKF